MHSPDRRYWWDGSEWRLAVSPDGRLWFDGTAWRPNPLGPPGLPRVPTRWTRPLQVAVVAITLIGFGSFLATLPMALGLMLTPSVVVVPEGTNPQEAARFIQEMRPIMVASIIVMAVVFGAPVALIVIGAVKRWQWMFWAVLVLLGLNTVNVLVPLLLRVAGLLPALPGAISRQPPPAVMAVSVIGTVELAASVVLFAAMLVAGVRIGPWACRRTAEVAPAGLPPLPESRSASR